MILIQLLKNNMITSQDSKCLLQYFTHITQTSLRSTAQNDTHYAIFPMRSHLHENDAEQGGNP